MGDAYIFSKPSQIVKSVSRASAVFLLVASTILGASVAAAKSLPPLPDRNPQRVDWKYKAWKSTKATVYCLGDKIIHSDITRQYNKEDGSEGKVSGLENSMGFISCAGKEGGKIFKVLKMLTGAPPDP